MKIKAFTLIEVMISVIIITIVGLGLLQIHSNHTKTFEFAIDRIDINEKASIALNNYSEELEDKDRTLMEIVKSKYPDFRNDDLEQILKDEEVHIEKVEVSQIEPFATDMEEEEGDEFIDDEEDGGAGVEMEPILLNRVDVRFKEGGTYIYSFEFEGMDTTPPVVGGGSGGGGSGGGGSGGGGSGGGGSGGGGSGGGGSGGGGSGGGSSSEIPQFNM